MKIRKHKGINQKTGKLNKGFKYSGKKLKSGLAEIVKVKRKQKGGSSICPDFYKNVCKSDYHGNDIWHHRCSPNNNVEYNIGLMERKDRCARLRYETQQCRKYNFESTDKGHLGAINKMANHRDECESVIKRQFGR